MKNFNVILFNGTAPLDTFGPVQAISSLGDRYEINYYSEKGGIINAGQNLRIDTLPLSKAPDGGIILIPGGFGTRQEVDNSNFINMIKDKAEKAEYVLTVCTGSALLAKTGLLYNKKATSNRIAFDWVKQQGAGVIWQDNARWEKDGKFYTSAGVTAGIDMILGFISDTLSPAAAQKVAEGMEYNQAYKA